MSVPDIQQKLNHLQSILNDCGRVAVAFSGGVDSTFLLKTAFDLDGKVLALFADSTVQPPGEREGAVRLAAQIGCQLRIIGFDLLDFADFVKNPSDRCYLCKKKIFSSFLDYAGKEGIACLVDGTNLDDLSEDRPGARAIKELGVRSPLAAAGLRKDDIRLLSRQLNLSTWNKPSASCLATRIPTGRVITDELLSVVARGESYLHKLGFLGCRVRIIEDSCCLELAHGDVKRVAGSDELAEIRKYFRSLGFKKVFLDLSERGGILT